MVPSLPPPLHVQASQLSLVISSLCDTVGMYSQSLITERRVASECGAITALASRLFLTILVKTEAGSALHQQLQVRGVCVHAYIAFSPASALHMCNYSE